MDRAQATDRADQFQRRHGAAGVAVATAKKFREDQSTNMASMIAFWAFFSVFPLLLAFVTLLGFFLPASTKNSVLAHVAAMFPLLNPSTVKGLSGQWWPLVVGLVSALWSGSAVVRTTQYAFNSVWEIPQAERPKLGAKIARSVLVLGTVGVGLVAATLVSGFVTGQSTGINLGVAGRVGGFIVALVLDVGLFLAAFRLLTSRAVTWRDMLPGAALSGIAFFVLQQVSSLIIARYLHNAQSTYGHFAVVITMLWWFYLQAIVTLLGAQLNVVLHEQLYPRGLAGRTEADRRALAAYPEKQRRAEDVTVDTAPGQRRAAGGGFPAEDADRRGG